MAAMPNAPEALVYVNEDGSVRELTDADKTYVATQFSPLDGARPNVKSRYSDRTEVPQGFSIQPAPQQDKQPQTPQTVCRFIIGTYP